MDKCLCLGLVKGLALASPGPSRPPYAICNMHASLLSNFNCITFKAEAEISVADQWLKNQSFKQFQNAILISDDEKPHKKKKLKKKK